MQSLTFSCPKTGRSIDAGIQTDAGTLATVRPVKLKVYCNHCLVDHELGIECARLAQTEDNAPKPMALVLAINEFRISCLRRNLGKAGH